MRIKITQKIALAAIGIAMLCIATMVWVTTQNLKHGFIAYLNEVQAQELEEVRDLLVEEYRRQGNFDWLRHNRRAMRDLLERHSPQPESDRRTLPPPPMRRDDFAPPHLREERLSPPPREGRSDRPPPPLMQRLSIKDDRGHPIFGPPDPSPGIARLIVVDGRTVGTLSLLPLRQIDSATDRNFVRGQIRNLLWLAGVLVLLAALLAVGLARHLLRPIASLRNVTQRIALGHLDARSPIVNRDELGELAHHINEMAKALETHERQRRKMLADVSHELRTPLAVVRGELEALIDGIRQVDEKAIASLYAEVMRLNKMVDDLYQLALADAGDLHYQRQNIDLTQLLGEILNRYRSRVEAAGLRLTINFSQHVANVMADSGRITQVITNLLENSMRYTNAGGTIAASVQVKGRHIEMCIEDSAPGVPEGTHAKLFERLYRVDQARSRERGGSGLGLAICKVMVEAHGGDIQASPSSLGGVKIVVRLPKAGNAA
ncbi:MAG: HAMP domain-containing protein [Burkholderiales bacterium]|nr:HAMP domain-containing protein [Burkholderiales bacterium]